MPLIAEWMIELPAEFAGIVDAQQPHVTGQADGGRTVR